MEDSVLKRKGAPPHCVKGRGKTHEKTKKTKTKNDTETKTLILFRESNTSKRLKSEICLFDTVE